MSIDPRPPAEFDFPLSFTGPDGIGATPFDEFRTDEAPDVSDVQGDDPAVALRKTLGQFATGVTVVTTLKGEQVHGMTANAFMSVSLEPPLVLVSVDRRTKMCNLLHEGCHYGVSVLCETQSALSDRFAGRGGRGPSRAALLRWCGTPRSWTARWRTSWPWCRVPTGAATTRCSSAAWSTPAITRARRCSSTAGATNG